MKLTKAFSKTKAIPLTTLRKEDGVRTETGSETLKVMFDTHFPELKVIQDDHGPISWKEQQRRTSKYDWIIAKREVDECNVKWALESFQSFKAPGPDNIYPILLQQGASILGPHLCRLYKACIAFGHIPWTWRRVKAIFLPKTGKPDYEKLKAFRPISLQSFSWRPWKRW